MRDYHESIASTAIDLDRRFIEVRAGQAKTASRRIIPISDNLAAWLAPLERRGKVVRMRYLSAFMVTGARCQRGRALRGFAAVRISAQNA